MHKESFGAAMPVEQGDSVEKLIVGELNEEVREQRVEVRRMTGELIPLIEQVRQWSVEPLSAEEREKLNQIRLHLDEFKAELTAANDTCQVEEEVLKELSEAA